MRKLGIAAAMTLTASAAFASNFRAADQVYVPVAAHATGASGVFITDAYLSNLSTDSVDVAVIYVPRGENANSNSPANLEELRGRITLAPLERKEFKDIFVNTLGKSAGSNPFGMLVFNGCKAGTSCGPDTQDAQTGVSPNFRAISVETRISQTIADRGSTGQLFSGIPWYSFVSTLQSAVQLDKIFITGITQTGNEGTAGTFRSNIGVVNASEYSKTDIRFKLYQGTLSDANLKATATRSLGPLGNQLYLFNELFPGAANGSNYFVTVEQATVSAVPGSPSSCDQGCPAFLAYGSILDNISGDATTLESQYLIEMDPDVLDILYPLGTGKNVMRRLVRH